jgi:sigma-E factor negative regulatory protein RseC
MLEETATVLETAQGKARVTAERKSSCGHCSANQTCGTSVLSKYVGKRSMDMWVKDPLGVQPGDEVLIRMEEGGLLMGSLAVYLLPLLLLIGFALLGDSMAGNLDWNREATAITFAVIGAFISYLWLQRFNRRIAASDRYRPVIVERVTAVSYIDMKTLLKPN